MDVGSGRFMYKNSKNNTVRIGTANVLADITVTILPFLCLTITGMMGNHVELVIGGLVLTAVGFCVSMSAHTNNDINEECNTLGNIRGKTLPSSYLDRWRFQKMYDMYHRAFLEENNQAVQKHNKLVEFKQTSGVATIESTILAISKDISQLSTLSSQIGSQLHHNNQMIEKVKASGMSGDIVDKVIAKLEATNDTLITKRSELDSYITSKKQEARQFTATADELSNCWLLLDAANCVELSGALVDKAKIAIESISALEADTSNALTGATKEVHSLLSETCRVLA